MSSGHASRRRGTPEERFWRNVAKGEGCWEWTAHVGKVDGYGRILLAPRGKTVAVHRFSWQIHFGEPPRELHVCHKCDNRRCVRPDHLFLGTDQDNCDDKIAKGRGSHGVNYDPVTKKLTEEKVMAIRRGLREGESLSALGRLYGVRPSTIANIRDRVTWKRIP